MSRDDNGLLIKRPSYLVRKHGGKRAVREPCRCGLTVSTKPGVSRFSRDGIGKKRSDCGFPEGGHVAPARLNGAITLKSIWTERPGKKGHRREGVMSGAGTSVDREVRVDRHAGAVAVPSRGGSA